MNPLHEHRLLLNRRHFFSRAGLGLGALGLASLLDENVSGAAAPGGLPGVPHFAAKAKRVIYLFQSGAPSQLDLFDAKPKLAGLHATELPDSIRKGQRLTGMTATQDQFPVAPTKFKFAQHGRGGAWFSELLPHTARAADELCVVRSMFTEAINHDPAITFFQTGAQLAGRPSIGSWLSYGLGSDNSDLPAFVALISNGSGNPNDQPLYDRLWGSGFLPTKHQGVKFRSAGDPVLFLSNPAGLDAAARRRMLDDLAKLNALQHAEVGDPEIATRIAQYELAFKMQSSVPELTDFKNEPAAMLDLYGIKEPGDGSFASNCLLARRLAERGVRMIQLYHRAWDHHSDLEPGMKTAAKDVDQATAALIKDLKQRGMLDDTLILWGGEFGRTPMGQGTGRDHHILGFSVFMAGGGVKAGTVYGSTDELGYRALENPVNVHDLHATMLALMGVDHRRLNSKYQGLDVRLTGIAGEVVKGLMA